MNISPANRATVTFLPDREPKSFFEPGGGFERISGSGSLFARRFSNLTDIAPGSGLRRIGGAARNLDLAFGSSNTAQSPTTEDTTSVDITA